MNLPEKFNVVNTHNGQFVELSRVNPWKYHAKYERGNTVFVDFVPVERLEKEIKEGIIHIVNRGNEKLEGIALRSRTSAEFIDLISNTMTALTTAVMTSVATTVLVLNRVMYGKKPT